MVSDLFVDKKYVSGKDFVAEEKLKCLFRVSFRWNEILKTRQIAYFEEWELSCASFLFS
jgi:hypothetical protein